MASDNFELLAGIVLVIYCAYERYCAPSNLLTQDVSSAQSARHIHSARASTTPLRFYSSVFSYCLLYVIFFLILLLFFPGAAVQSEEQVERLIGIGNLPAEITLAVLLSVLMPKLPLISTIDGKIIGFFHRAAAIPLEALHLSGKLMNSHIQVTSDDLRSKIDSDLLEMGVSEEVVGGSHYLINKWIEVSALMHQIRSWKSDRRFTAFLFENRSQYEQILGEYDRADKLARKVISLRQHTSILGAPILGENVHEANELSRDSAEESGLRAHLNDMLDTTHRLEENLDETLDHIRAGLCDFIAHGVLRVFVTIQKRDNYLISIGFTHNPETSPNIWLVNRMVGLLIGLIFLLLIVTVVMFSRSDGLTAIFSRITMIAAIYVVSIGWILLPRGFGGIFAYHDGHGLPFLGYSISAIGTLFTSGLVSTGYRALQNLSIGVETPFLAAWAVTSNQSYPWFLMGFVSTLYLCLMCDIQFRILLPTLTKRFLIALGLVVVLAMTGYLVIEWLEQINSGSSFNVPPYRQVLAYSSIAGFLLGFLVPEWYRLQYAPNLKSTE